MSIQPARQVFSHALFVFTLPPEEYFGLLSSEIHEIWVAEYCSSLGTTLRYFPSDGFETFPLPVVTSRLRSAGQHFAGLRKQLMMQQGVGLTRLYNSMHEPESSDDVRELRDLYRELTEAVAESYGWSDLSREIGFHDLPSGERFGLPGTSRREILERLLELNHQRHAEEVAAGLVDETGKQLRSKAGGRAGTKRGAASAQTAMPGLG